MHAARLRTVRSFWSDTPVRQSASSSPTARRASEESGILLATGSTQKNEFLLPGHQQGLEGGGDNTSAAVSSASALTGRRVAP